MLAATWPKERLLWHLRERSGLYALTFVFVLLGLIMGAVAVGVLSPLQRADLLDYLGSFLSQIGQGLPSGPVLMRLALAEELKGLLLLWLLGLTVIGLPAVLLLLLVRGFVFGFTAAFLAQELAGRGLTLVISGVLPAALFILPASMMMAVAACRFAAQIVHARTGPRAVGLQAVGSYLMAALVPLLLIVVASALEAYLTPFVLSSLAAYLRG